MLVTVKRAGKVGGCGKVRQVWKCVSGCGNARLVFKNVKREAWDF